MNKKQKRGLIISMLVILFVSITHLSEVGSGTIIAPQMVVLRFESSLRKGWT